MHSVFKLYLAHPITGLSGQEVLEYYENIKRRIPSEIQILCPMTGKGYLRTRSSLKPTGNINPCSTDHAIFTRDKWMVEQADIVLCDFTNAVRVSIGCCMELAIAVCSGKHVIVVLDKNNIHNHAFVKEASNIIFGELNEALDYINLLASSSFE